MTDSNMHKSPEIDTSAEAVERGAGMNDQTKLERLPPDHPAPDQHRQDGRQPMNAIYSPDTPPLIAVSQWAADYRRKKYLAAVSAHQNRKGLRRAWEKANARLVWATSISSKEEARKAKAERRRSHLAVLDAVEVELDKIGEML